MLAVYPERVCCARSGRPVRPLVRYRTDSSLGRRRKRFVHPGIGIAHLHIIHAGHERHAHPADGILSIHDARPRFREPATRVRWALILCGGYEMRQDILMIHVRVPLPDKSGNPSDYGRPVRRILCRLERGAVRRHWRCRHIVKNDKIGLPAVPGVTWAVSVPSCGGNRDYLRQLGRKRNLVLLKKWIIASRACASSPDEYMISGVVEMHDLILEMWSSPGLVDTLV